MIRGLKTPLVKSELSILHTMIQVKNLSKTFRTHKKAPGLAGSVKSLFVRKYVETKALQNFSLNLKEGEIIGLVGANGAGKTTLVKILSGIIHPDGGEVRVLGHDPWKRETAFRKQISLIMGQKAQLWWDLPAADCFLLLKEIYSLPENVYRANLEKLTKVLDVGDKLNVQIRRLSLGERMKMELIASLLHNPRVVFLDEPTIGLDLTAQRSIRNFIKEYMDEFKPAMILTSHYMEDIKQLCDRIVIMREGTSVYDGKLKEISSHYENTKIISLTLDGQTAEADIPTLDPALGERVLLTNKSYAENAYKIRYRVQRTLVKEAIQSLLQTPAVIADISIEENSIETIIESIIKVKNRSL